jgi:hypothetical protein
MNITTQTNNTYTDISCYVPSTCTAIECCVDSVKLGRTFHVGIALDPCQFVISVGIENFVHNLSLAQYTMGKYGCTIV